jgi:hypothetical protein
VIRYNLRDIKSVRLHGTLHFTIFEHRTIMEHQIEQARDLVERE